MMPSPRSATWPAPGESGTGIVCLNKPLARFGFAFRRTRVLPMIRLSKCSSRGFARTGAAFTRQIRVHRPRVFVKFYESRRLPFWSFIHAVTTEVQAGRVPSVIVLGVMSR